MYRAFRKTARGPVYISDQDGCFTDADGDCVSPGPCIHTDGAECRYFAVKTTNDPTNGIHAFLRYFPTANNCVIFQILADDWPDAKDAGTILRKRWEEAREHEKEKLRRLEERRR